MKKKINNKCSLPVKSNFFKNNLDIFSKNYNTISPCNSKSSIVSDRFIPLRMKGLAKNLFGLRKRLEAKFNASIEEEE